MDMHPDLRHLSIYPDTSLDRPEMPMYKGFRAREVSLGYLPQTSLIPPSYLPKNVCIYGSRNMRTDGLMREVWVRYKGGIREVCCRHLPMPNPFVYRGFKGVEGGIGLFLQCSVAKINLARMMFIPFVIADANKQKPPGILS